MGQLVNIKAAYQLCNSLFGVDPDPDTFEDVALVGWEKIGNKHTRLYRYKANTKDKELVLPCNVEIIESVTIPALSAQTTSNKTDIVDLENVRVEGYIEAFKQDKDPFYTSGNYIKYKEGNGVLYFTRDYDDVTVLYHGILADDEDGLPLVNEKELRAIATFVAWRETYKDAIRRKDRNSFTIAQYIEAEWYRACNAARVKDHLNQNDMNAILDVKTRWDRKIYGKSSMPIL